MIEPNMQLPDRVRVLILGGGIHGVGLLHDLASRGWQDILLVEKSGLGAGTSSRSTKLIHGGLRYLKNIQDFGLVTEALRERSLLMKLAGDLVTPLEFCLPVLKRGGHSRFVLRSGLFLYDTLAGKHRIKRHRSIPMATVSQSLPMLETERFTKCYGFWDTQTDDLRLVHRIANSAKMLGATIATQCEALRILPEQDGWTVEVREPSGNIRRISALYVFNALGPWANRFLEASDLQPHYHGINNKGIHLVLPDYGQTIGAFLQSPKDARIFFVLPWQGKTLVGTTETLFSGSPDTMQVDNDDIHYLLERCNSYFRFPVSEKDIVQSFAGLRWLAVKDRGASLSRTSRSYSLSEHTSYGRGLLFTLYGGKLTTYRAFSETLGDQITNHFGEFRSTKTHLSESWAGSESDASAADAFERFRPGGVAHSPRQS